MMFGLITYALNSIRTVSVYNLKSLEAPKLAVPTESGIFQASAARLFNTLPDRFRQEPDYNKFVSLAKKLMFSVGESI